MAEGQGSSLPPASNQRVYLQSLVEPSLLQAGAIVVTGGEDNNRVPLITFSTLVIDQLLRDQGGSKVTCDSLLALLRYQQSFLPVPRSHKVAPFAAMAQFSACSKECIILVLDTLDKLELQFKDTVAVLYAVSPNSHSNQKLLRKLLGVYPSKRYRRAALYMAVVSGEEEEMTKYIPSTQLTPEFDGYLLYNHRQWLRFQESTAELEESISTSLRQCPEAHDALVGLSNVDIPSDQDRISSVLLQLRHTYHLIIRRLNLEELIDECNELLEGLQSPLNHPKLQSIAQHPILREKHFSIARRQSELVTCREKLKSLWQHAESRVVLSAKLGKYQAKAEKILVWLEDVGMPAVRQDPDIGKNLEEATVLQTHFVTSFYNTAKRVLWLAEKLLEKMDNALSEASSKYQQDLPNRSSAAEFGGQFREAVGYFSQLLEGKHQVFVDVVNHYSMADMNGPHWSLDGMEAHPKLTISNYLQQITRWYQRTLAFLPIHLLCVRVPANGPTSSQDIRLYCSPAWTSVVQNFLSNHPAPGLNNLTKVRNVIPVITDVLERKQAKLLIHRVEVLCKLLLETQSVNSVELNDIMRWRKHVMHGADDLVLRFTFDKNNHKILTLEALYGGQQVNQGQHVERDQILASPVTQSLGTSVERQHMQNNDVEVNPSTGRHSAHRQQSFGIYGDADKLRLSGAHRNRTNLPHSERYVSLHNPKTQKIPETLQHIDVHALEHNQPQGATTPRKRYSPAYSSPEPGMLSSNRQLTKSVPSLPTCWQYIRPADLIAGSQLTHEEKMAALAAFGEQPGNQSRPATTGDTHRSKAHTPTGEANVQPGPDWQQTGIDIEHWISQHPTNDNGDIPGSHSTSAEGDLISYQERLRHAEKSRLVEELELERELSRLARLKLEKEELRQDTIQMTLNRTGRMLQRQEESLKDDKIKSKETLAPSSHLHRGHTDSGSSNSEESGVFTYASTSSKALYSMSRSLHNLHQPYDQMSPPTTLPETISDSASLDDLTVPAPEEYRDSDEEGDSGWHQGQSRSSVDSFGEFASNSVTDTSTGESMETVIHRQK